MQIGRKVLEIWQGVFIGYSAIDGDKEHQGGCIRLMMGGGGLDPRLPDWVTGTIAETGRGAYVVGGLRRQLTCPGVTHHCLPVWCACLQAGSVEIWHQIKHWHHTVEAIASQQKWC
jgi:hypothetical protein